MRLRVMLGVLLVAGVVGCDRSEPGGTSPTAEKLKRDVQQVGEDLNVAARQAATQVKPQVEAAEEKAREAVNAAANRVAQETATRPATMPQ